MAVGRVGGTAQSDSAQRRRSLGRQSRDQQGVVRGSAGIILVSHVATVARQNIPGHTGLGFKKGMFALFCSTHLFWVFLAGYVLGTEGLETFVLHACCHWSNPSVSWGSSVLQSWEFVHEKGNDCSSVPHKMAWRSGARAIRMGSTPWWTRVRNF